MNTWVRSICAHSPYFAQHSRNICFFQASPVKRKTAFFKRHWHNSCKGWALVQPRLPKLSMGHVFNINSLDVCLLALKVQVAKAEILFGHKRLQ